MNAKTKNRLLIAGVLLLLFISYRFAIKNTLLAKSKFNEFESRKNLVGNVPKAIASLRQKEVYYDSVLTALDMGNTSVQNNLLRVVNRNAKKNNVKVINFQEPHSQVQDENEILTYRFTIGGGYLDLLKVIHDVEQKGSFGSIVHLEFDKKKDYRTNRQSLEATIFLQQIQ